MNQPLISVIIPTRNRCEILPRAIESVLKQTYNNIELIIVDDASEDTTTATIEKYRNKFNVFKHIKNKTQGGGAKARNIGIKNARGEYIAFLDDDDEWSAEKLVLQFEFLTEHPDVIAVSCWYIKDIGNKIIKVQIKEDMSFDDMLWANFFGSFSFTMVRSTIFKKIGLLDENLSSCHDWEFWLRASEDYKLGVVNAYLTRYYWHSENLNRLISGKLSSYFKLYEMYKDRMNERCKKFHKKRFIIFGTKDVKGIESKIKKFLALIKKYNLSFKTDFAFVIYRILILCLKDVNFFRNVHNFFRKFHNTEIRKIPNV